MSMSLHWTLDDPVERYEHAGLTVEIHHDDDPSSPREWSNVGTMLCSHPRRDLGDEQLSGSEHFDVECPACEGDGERALYLIATRLRVYENEMIGPFPPDCAWCEGCREVSLTPGEWAKREHGARVVLPLFVYEHGGIAMSTSRAGQFSDPWDSGQVGIIYDTPEGVKDCLGDATDEQIAKALEQEVATYDEFLQGLVYTYRVLGPDGEFMDELLGAIDGYDGCGDIYGLEYTREEANAIAEQLAVALAAERAEADYWRAREVLTV